VIALALDALLTGETTGFQADIGGITSVTPQMLPVLVPLVLVNVVIGLLLMVGRALQVGMVVGFGWAAAGVAIVLTGGGPAPLALSALFLSLMLWGGDATIGEGRARKARVMVGLIVAGFVAVLLLRQLASS